MGYISWTFCARKDNTKPPEKPHRKMSSQKYQPPIYKVPSDPSKRLKVVLHYFDVLKRWDFDALSKLSTSNFTQQTLPATLGLSPRSKSEDIEFLHSFRDSLKGAPLEVGNPQTCFGGADTHSRSISTRSTRIRVEFGSTYVSFLLEAQPPCARANAHLLIYCCFAAVHENGQQRVLFQFHIWNRQGREPHHQPHRVCRQQSVRW